MKDLDNKVLVLYYHRINQIKNDPFELCVSAENFEEQIKFLKEQYHILRFEDNWNKADNGIVITFDDGYADNLYIALPILKKYQVPATIFISSGQIEKNEINWWDELYELIVVHNHNDIIEIADEQYGCTWKTYDDELKLNCFYAIHKLIKHYIDIDKRDSIMKQLRRQVCITSFSDEYDLLTKEDISKLSKEKLVTIGGHTVSHSSLGRLSKEQQEKEIKDNIYYLENLIEKNINVFSYPFGAVDIDINSDTIEICKKLGINKAATTEHKTWEEEKCNLMIPRCEVKNWNLKEFSRRIDGFWR